jgi:site-specific DNA-methyltransferase (adenine-specific)
MEKQMLELNNIYNMDCVEGLKLLDDNSIDLIVTSPPYNVGMKYDSWNDSIPWDEYLDWCKLWLQECYRVLKDDGRICINHYLCYNMKDDISRFPLFEFKNIMDDIGYITHKIAIWDDITRTKLTAWGSWLSASAPFITTPYEGILIAYKKQWNKINKGESTISREDFKEGVSGIWHIGTTTGYTVACFPERLPQLCIDLLSYKNDIILDPFSGSGTTCYVAKGMDRRYIGFEISEAYHKESISRLQGYPYKVVPNNNPHNKKETRSHLTLF